MKLLKIAVIGDSHVNFFGGHEYLSFMPLSSLRNLSHWDGGGVLTFVMV